MAELDILLTGEEPEEKPTGSVNFGLNELHISRYAYEKAFRYARLVMRGRKGSVEIGGFLTKPKDSQDRVARDAFLARDQEVSRAMYKLDAGDVAKAGKELEQQGQQIIGWWHSHGKFNTFHSKIDDGNQMVLLNQISPSNYVLFPQERIYGGLQSRVEGNVITFWDPENPATEFQLELKDERPELVAHSLRIFEEKRVGFAYSFVVNCHRWLRKRIPYCEIAMRDLCNVCRNPVDRSVSVGCKVFDYGEEDIDDYQLMEEIGDKVHVAGEFKGKREYFLPATFEEKRAAGTLTKPNFGPGSYTPRVRAVAGKTVKRSRKSGPKISKGAKK